MSAATAAVRPPARRGGPPTAAPAGFDYLALRPEQRAVAVGAAQRVRLHANRTRESLAEIGRELEAAKRSLGHGLFLAWLAAEFPAFSDDTAGRYMALARIVPQIPHGAESNFTLTSLYALGRRDMPPDAKEALFARAAAGERITEAAVREHPGGEPPTAGPAFPPTSPSAPVPPPTTRRSGADSRPAASGQSEKGSPMVAIKESAELRGSPERLRRPEELSAWSDWHYQTPHPLAEVLAPGYFEHAARYLRRFDRIHVTCTTDALHERDGLGPASHAVAVVSRHEKVPGGRFDIRVTPFRLSVEDPSNAPRLDGEGRRLDAA